MLLARSARDARDRVVTHNLAQARRIAQDALILLDARLVEAGEASRVLSDPDDPDACDFVKGYVG